MKAQIVDGTSN